MGRKPTVSKETILEAAFGILDSEGYDKVNIKTVAAKAGCSTQPVSWHFGNMQTFRKELHEYCNIKMWSDLAGTVYSLPPVEAFFETGKNYISIACDHPNVFRFLHLDNIPEIYDENASLMDMLGDSKIIGLLAKEYSADMNLIEEAVKDIVIYTHGLSCLSLLSIMKIDREKAYDMIYENGRQRFKAIGIDIGERK